MAAKDKEAAALPEGQAEKPRKKSRIKRIVIILAILLMTLGGAGLGRFLLRGACGGVGGRMEPAPERPGVHDPRHAAEDAGTGAAPPRDRLDVAVGPGDEGVKLAVGGGVLDGAGVERGRGGRGVECRLAQGGDVLVGRGAGTRGRPERGGVGRGGGARKGDGEGG